MYGIECATQYPISEWLARDLDVFSPTASFFVVDPRQHRVCGRGRGLVFSSVRYQGIHCRFGSRGVIAENHFDAGRNMVALLAGVSPDARHKYTQNVQGPNATSCSRLQSADTCTYTPAPIPKVALMVCLLCRLNPRRPPLNGRLEPAGPRPVSPHVARTVCHMLAMYAS
jgi:hypothetical protein